MGRRKRNDIKEEPNNVEYVDMEKLMNSDITYQTVRTPIDTIISRMEAGHYFIPEYQRNYVWKEKQVIALIISLLRDIPIPRLYMYSNPKDGKYTIIDGQQRITSLFFFLKGVFPSSKTKRHYYNFKKISQLVDKHQQANSKKEQRQIRKDLREQFGLKFKEFNYKKDNGENKKFTYESFEEPQKLMFNNKSLDFSIVSVKNDDDFYSVYTDIFRLLNSAGEPLSSQEIRNGIYYGSILYKQINMFNEENQAWLKIKKNENNRHGNVEFLLRLLALNKYIEIKSKEELIDYVINEFDEKDFDSKNLAKIDKLNEVMTLEKYSTYSNLVDKYSKEYSVHKFEDEVEKEIEKLRCFIEGVDKFPKDEKHIDKLRVEAFFIAASKLDIINKNFKISYNKLTEELNSSEHTSSKKSIFKRILQAIKIIKESGENNGL